MGNDASEQREAWVNHVLLSHHVFVDFARQCAPIDVGAIFQLPAHIVGLRGTLAACKIYQRQLASVDLQQHEGSDGR